MSASYELLETLQADVLALLLATPALANCAIIADADGDTESKVTKALSTTIKNRSDKYGLALIVLAPEVTTAEKNLPGPPLLVRLDVQTLEHVQTNRGPSGTGLRSSHAAMIALSTLHLHQLGSHALYADSKPIEPLPAVAGMVSHSITLYLRAGGIAVAAKPLGVEAARNAVPTILVTGTSMIPQVGVDIGTLFGSGDPEDGRDSYNSSGALVQAFWSALSGKWVIQSASYRAEKVSAALTPVGLTGWTITQGSGQPTVAAGSAASMAALTCASPDSVIYYTTDGTYPSPSTHPYNGPIHLDPLATGTVIRAAGYVAGMPPGDVLEFTITE